MRRIVNNDEGSMMFYRVAPVSRVVGGHVLPLQWVLESAHVLWMDGCLKYGYSEKDTKFEKICH